MSFQHAQPGCPTLCLFVLLRAGDATSYVPLEYLSFRLCKRAIHCIRAHCLTELAFAELRLLSSFQFLELAPVRHAYITFPSMPFRSRANSLRPRLILLFTVPWGTPRTSAISL